MIARQDLPLLSDLIARTKPGDLVFVYPYAPLYYFLADVRNPTRFNVIVDQSVVNPLVREAVRDLQTKKPRYVVADTSLLGQGMTTMFPALQVPAPKDRAVDCYVASHYHLLKAESGWQLLERNALPD